MKEAYIVKLGEGAKGTHLHTCSYVFSLTAVTFLHLDDVIEQR
jgi:hypothetical protein